ncbi:unnamed protein product, partial [Prorocentrum cordatum]
MRALRVARALRHGADPAHARAEFLDALRGGLALDDVAALSLRFAELRPPPLPEFFAEVATHVEAGAAHDGFQLGGRAAVLLAGTWHSAEHGRQRRA